MSAGSPTDRRYNPCLHEQAGQLSSSDLVQIKLGDRRGLWLVRDNGRIGAARLGDVDLRIAPKITIPRLFFLLG